MKLVSIALYIVAFCLLGSNKVGYWPPIIMVGIAGAVWAMGC